MCVVASATWGGACVLNPAPAAPAANRVSFTAMDLAVSPDRTFLLVATDKSKLLLYKIGRNAQLRQVTARPPAAAPKHSCPPLTPAASTFRRCRRRRRSSVLAAAMPWPWPPPPHRHGIPRQFFGAENDGFSNPRCLWHPNGQYVYCTAQDNTVHGALLLGTPHQHTKPGCFAWGGVT